MMADLFEEPFEAMLAEGKPNGLGRVVEVVSAVLANPNRMDELFQCYSSQNQWVRLRVSNAMKRLQAEQTSLLEPYFDRFIDEVGALDQPSAQWTLAQVFLRAEKALSVQQKGRICAVLKRNLVEYNDWIVLNMTIQTLSTWAKSDTALRHWLMPQLERLSVDPRKSVATRAGKNLKTLEQSAKE